LPLLVHHRIRRVHFTTSDGLRTLDLTGMTAARASSSPLSFSPSLSSQLLQGSRLGDESETDSNSESHAESQAESDSAALARCTHRGIVKPTALGKYGFIEACEFLSARVCNVDPARDDTCSTSTAAASINGAPDCSKVDKPCGAGSREVAEEDASTVGIQQQQLQQAGGVGTTTTTTPAPAADHLQQAGSDDTTITTAAAADQLQHQGDVFFPLSAVHLCRDDRHNPSLRRFPDGSPFMQRAFRNFLSGRPVAFCLEEGAAVVEVDDSEGAAVVEVDDSEGAAAVEVDDSEGSAVVEVDDSEGSAVVEVDDSEGKGKGKGEGADGEKAPHRRHRQRERRQQRRPQAVLVVPLAWPLIADYDKQDGMLISQITSPPMPPPQSSSSHVTPAETQG
jgi:hypothetical protein